jgi:N-acetylglucosaminyldiphosphoundecaprenol N-acetyl-beta-D-mannosaminyltransferase
MSRIFNEDTAIPSIRLFGLPVACLSISQTVQWILHQTEQKKTVMHADINTFKVVLMKEDAQLFRSVAKADIISADGMGIVWAARLLGKKLPGRVTGIDLMGELVEKAAQNHKTIYLLGAKAEVVQKLTELYTHKYGNGFVAGFQDGYFKEQDAAQVALAIAEAKPDFLFVGMTSPRKENFLFHQEAILSSVPFKMGVGGSFDVLSGMISRAPLWIQKSGLEWLYRLSKEPRRLFKRYTLDNLRFLFLLLKEWWRPA